MKRGKSFTEIIEISKKLIYPMALIAIILLIVVCLLHLCECLPTFKLAADRYDVLVDTLAILLIVIGVASAGMFWALNRLVRDSVEKDIAKRFSNIQGKQLIFHGYTCWIGNMIDEAIRITTNALNYDLDEMDRLWIKNNLAYYYAQKHSAEPQWDLKDRALEFAEYIYSKYDKYSAIYNRAGWVETYAFVKAKFAKGDREKQEAKKLVEDLIRREDLREVREKLQETLSGLSNK